MCTATGAHDETQVGPERRTLGSIVLERRLGKQIVIGDGALLGHLVLYVRGGSLRFLSYAGSPLVLASYKRESWWGCKDEAAGRSLVQILVRVEGATDRGTWTRVTYAVHDGVARREGTETGETLMPSDGGLPVVPGTVVGFSNCEYRPGGSF